MDCLLHKISEKNYPIISTTYYIFKNSKTWEPSNVGLLNCDATEVCIIFVAGNLASTRCQLHPSSSNYISPTNGST